MHDEWTTYSKFAFKRSFFCISRITWYFLNISILLFLNEHLKIHEHRISRSISVYIILKKFEYFIYRIFKKTNINMKNVYNNIKLLKSISEFTFF